MNVGLTRARLCLIVIGNFETLSVSPHWRAMLLDAQQRNLRIFYRNAQGDTKTKRVILLFHLRLFYYFFNLFFSFFIFKFLFNYLFTYILR